MGVFNKLVLDQDGLLVGKRQIDASQDGVYFSGNGHFGSDLVVTGNSAFNDSISVTKSLQVIGTINSASITIGTIFVANSNNVISTGNTQLNSLGIGTAASGTSGEIRATNNITAYYSSDKKYKENIRPIPNALQKVKAVGGKLFDWTEEYIEEHGGVDGYFIRKSDFGVIAQDLIAADFSEGVRERNDGTLAVDYEKLSALAFQAILEQQEIIEKLEQKIDSLLEK